jgi:hypothetical protein
MSTGRQARKEVLRGLRIMVGEVYPILAFYGLYAGVVEFYAAVHPFTTLSPDQAKWIMLVTSPFNYIEAVGKTPAETTQGLYNNFLFPAALMIFSMLYNIVFSRRLRRYVSVPSIFGVSVIGSYLESWIVWKASPYPATGTSIIGFCFAVAIACTAFADLIAILFEFRRRPRGAPLGARMFLRLVPGWLFGAVALDIIFNSYLWGNPSYILHLTGGGISFVFLYLWTKVGNPSVPRLPRALSSESFRGILFVLIAALVVIIV